MAFAIRANLVKSVHKVLLDMQVFNMSKIQEQGNMSMLGMLGINTSEYIILATLVGDSFFTNEDAFFFHICSEGEVDIEDISIIACI